MLRTAHRSVTPSTHGQTHPHGRTIGYQAPADQNSAAPTITQPGTGLRTMRQATTAHTR